MPNCEYAFEDFPRQDLTFALSRRQLLTGIVTQLQVVRGQDEGRAAFSLARLGSATDAHLAGLIPAIEPECAISLSDDFVCGKLRSTPQPFPLFPREPAAITAFNGMNGYTPLRAIGDRVAEAMGWPPERGFAFARGLFLHLVQLRVCAIANLGG